MKARFTFIDLFAGIGGFHLAMHSIGGQCVFASEWDKDARLTYKENFKRISPELFINDKYFVGDITKVNPSDIPDHDLLCAGFPCQPFSQAGFKKGFKDTRGTLFFNVASIIKEKQPKTIFLENVRGLKNHDNGNTFKTIISVLDELGYKLHYKVVKASDFGLPQYRPRLFIIGIRKDFNDTFNYPKPIPLKIKMKDVFEANDVNKEIGFTLRVGGKGSPINDRRNWDGYIVDGTERRLTPKEGKMMQGFPKTFTFPVSTTAAMKQLGNSVAIPAIKAYGENLMNVVV